ncbi:MAG: hypothetical protein AAGA86_00635 [Bacteroidota bacterium]
MDFKTTSQRIAERNALDFGSIFSRSLDLFQKVWLQGFITLLLTILCILPFCLLFFVPLSIVGISDPEAFRNEELSLFIILIILIMFPVVILGASSVSLMLMASFYRICRIKDLNEATREDYFYFFKSRFLKKVVLLSLIIFGLSLSGMLLCGIGLFYLVVPLSLMPLFLAFNEKMSAVEITKASLALGNKHWLVIFGLMLLAGILAQAGILLCFIGAFFTIMFSKIPTYYIYKDGVGFERGTTSFENVLPE